MLLYILAVGLIQLATGNTLTFLFENEYNETTTMAQCRNNIDQILLNP